MGRLSRVRLRPASATRTGPEACAALVESYFGIDLRERLHEIPIPTLVLHGGLDAMPGGSADEARDLAAACQ